MDASEESGNTTAASAPIFQAFALLTGRLILLPTPLALHVRGYTDLYAALHGDVEFCTMAFGTGPDSFQPVDWTTDDKVLEVVKREVTRSWEVRGMGDFAVGIIPESVLQSFRDNAHGDYFMLDGKEFHKLFNDENNIEAVNWIGYAGIRDATTTSIPAYAAKDSPMLLSLQDLAWEDMVEVRYGLHPSAWGKGFGTESAMAVMSWGEQERGVRRYVAETDEKNAGSSGILKKLGFVRLDGRDIWGMEGKIEWEKRCRFLK